MLFINYKNDTPQQRFYSLGVKGNHNANKIRFVVARKQADIDLTDYVCNLKVENKEAEYKDLIMLDLVNESESELVFEWVMTNKSTQFRTLELQLEFLSTENESDVVWQTLIVGLELNDTIKVGDERPTDKELSVLKQVETEVKTYDNRITKNSEDIEELQREATNIIIANPNDYLGEQGLKKIIRQRESGNIEKSFLIDKIHHESTLVQANANTEEYDNGEEIDDFEIYNTIFDNMLGEVFGNTFYNSSMSHNYIINYDQDGIKTYGVDIGINGTYGNFELNDCTPNKVIRIIVGKYFEYDEQGNKVFDEHCALYSENYIDSAGDPNNDVREITEECQVFELKVRDNGFFYIDGDGGDLGFGNTRFILYGFECGEEAYDEYKAREIGGKGVPTLPMFKQSQTFGEVVQFYNEHKDEYGENGKMSFGIYPDYDMYSHTIVCDLSIVNNGFYFLGIDCYCRYEYHDNLSPTIMGLKLWNILDNCDFYDMATSNQLDQKENIINVDGIWWEQNDFNGNPLPNQSQSNLTDEQMTTYMNEIKSLITRGYVMYNQVLMKLAFVRYESSNVIQALFGYAGDDEVGFRIVITLDLVSHIYDFNKRDV